MKNSLIFITLLLSFTKLVGQQSNDSLWQVWNNSQNVDKVRVDALIKFVKNELLYSNADSAFVLADIGLDLLKNPDDIKRIEELHRIKGSSLGIRSHYQTALDIFSENLELCKEHNYTTGIANNLTNIAYMHASLGSFSKSLDLFLEAEEIYKNYDDVDGLTVCYNNIGVLYDRLGNSQQSLVYYEKSLELAIKEKSKQNMLNSYNNIGAIYNYQELYQEAVKYYLEAYYYAQELNDKESLALLYQNLGTIYMEIGEYEANRILARGGAMEILNNEEIKQERGPVNGYTAEELIRASLKLNKELGVQSGVGECYVLMGRITTDSKMAMKYFDKAYDIAESIDDFLLKVDVVQYLMSAQKEGGNYKDALELHELYIELRDSLNLEETQKKMIRQEYQFNYEKQIAADSIKHVEAQKIKQIEIEKQKVELKNQKNKQVLLYGGLAVALLFSIYFIRKNKQVREQKQEVEKQKEFADQQRREADRQRLIAEEQKEVLKYQHREIRDSINYAQNLQKAVLPSREDVSKNFPDSFVLYKPKDVVSGDFYWTYQKGDIVYLAVVDCTGHGVPGAFMTIVASNLLNEIIQGLASTPKEIIEELHHRIKLRVGGSPTAQVRDSMDLGLFSYHVATKEVRFVGTHTSIYRVRNSKLEKFKGSKADIGYKPGIAIEEQVFNVEPNDMLYMHSDGYPDQKGGPKGKKFYYQPIRNKLEEISLLNPLEQEQIMGKIFEDWKGDLEQFDDVCMIGIRII